MEVFLLRFFQKFDFRLFRGMLLGALFLGVGFIHIPGSTTDTIHPNHEIKMLSFAPVNQAQPFCAR